MTRVTAPRAPPAPPGDENEVVVQAIDVTKRFGKRVVLDGASLQVRRGQIVGVMGRSGSGKSTLVHILAGLDRPDEGVVRVGGLDLAIASSEERAQHRLHHIGIVFQHFNLLPDLTVLENVTLPLELSHEPRRSRQRRGEHLLGLFGLTPFRDLFPETLSGGELQRVATARALAPEPDVILADEPTANLDEQNAREALSALRTAAASGAGILVASHDTLVRDSVDRMLHIDRGAVVTRVAKEAGAGTSP